MRPLLRLPPTLRRLIRNDSGAALTEFAILLPLILLIFAVIIEGGRLMWAYQSVNAGVRDAARYLARVAPADVCAGGSLAGYQSTMETMVRQSIDGNAYFPIGITVNSVTPSLSCVAGSFRVSPAPVAQVTANLTVTFPFASVFDFAGSSLGSVTTSISDQSRIFGI